MESRIQFFTTIGTVLLLLLVLELVRRRRLHERYALLWLTGTFLLLVITIWQTLLKPIARFIGVIYPPNAIFVVAFGATLVILLHFSVEVSKLNDQVKILAQRLALLEERTQEDQAQTEKQSIDLPDTPPKANSAPKEPSPNPQ